MIEMSNMNLKWFLNEATDYRWVGYRHMWVAQTIGEISNAGWCSPRYISGAAVESGSVI
jgi:hypothetical protein